MNRRSFLRVAAAGAASAFGFAILPPATTYQRVWRAVAVPLFEELPLEPPAAGWVRFCVSSKSPDAPPWVLAYFDEKGTCITAAPSWEAWP